MGEQGWDGVDRWDGVGRNGMGLDGLAWGQLGRHAMGGWKWTGEKKWGEMDGWDGKEWGGEECSKTRRYRMAWVGLERIG